MPNIISQGAGSAKGFGFAAPSTSATYIEDVFSTYLYQGDGGTQTIVNGIDLATYGGMVWAKMRDYTTGVNHGVWDTARGAGTSNTVNRTLSTNTQDAQSVAQGDYISSFNTNGFTGVYGAGQTAYYWVNRGGANYVAWTFRKQAKFFDVVTYTGNATSGRTISHNLGSTPGFIIIKRTDGATNWAVYHRGLTSGANWSLLLNSTVSEFNTDNYWNSTAPTSTVFTLGNSGTVNANGGNYVAYLFAHNAGGFGASGTDNVITCGSYTTNASGVITSPVNLGYEPQWILSKRVDSARNWQILDVMRGDGSADGNLSNQYYLYPNLSDAENGPSYGEPAPTATGFTVTASTANSTYIYIAIRRGPMKTPTSGTSVFVPSLYRSGVAANTVITTGFNPDAVLPFRPSSNKFWTTRLLGNTGYLESSSTAAFTGISLVNYTSSSNSFVNAYAGIGEVIFYSLGRAPGFFDVVCYTGDGGFTVTRNHNLAAQPELIIVKSRGSAQNWAVAYRTSGTTYLYGLELNTTSVSSATTYNYGASMSATTFNSFVGSNINQSETNGVAYVAYLFATCPGVSKVGTYTGTGTTNQINCGFTGGARFVLIKRTDSTGDWYVWDSARGIVAGNDPYLLLNSTAAEVTNTDYVDTYSAGFELTSTAPAALNANGGSYLFFAIA